MRFHTPCTSQPSRRRVTGQGMTEYIIIVALIAIAAVSAVSFFGAGVEGQFVKLGGEILGTDDESGIAAANTTGTAARANVGGASLATYGDGSNIE